MIAYLKGDATAPQVPGPAILPHIVNSVGAWGAGYVLAISKRWSTPEDTYRKWAKDPGFALGRTQFVKVEPNMWVANMVAQEGLGRSADGRIPLRYKALESCLWEVAKFALAQEETPTIHMPRIGAGLGGGSWAKVEAIIEKTLGPFSVYVYDFPGSRFNP